METKIIAGEDVNLIRKTIIVRKYNSEKEGFKDKTYRLYSFMDKAFAVHEEDEFHEDLKKGDVQKVVLSVNDEGQLSLTNHVTWTRANAQRTAQVKFDSITVENFKVMQENPADLIA
jgi:hypothetical protein